MEVSSASHRRTNAEKRALREAGERRSQEQRSSGGKRRKLTGSENGVVKKEDSAGIGAKESMNNADVVNGDCKESSSEISDGESVALEASEKGDGLIRESRPVLIDKMNGFVHLQKETGETGGEENLKVVPVSDNNSTDGAVGELDPEDYFESLRNKDFLWEVVCRNEDHIHFLIEYFRETHKVGHGALAKALIDVVLPSVQKILQARKIAEKKKNRLVAVEVNGLYAGSHELRHSRRLEQKRIEREKRMEEQRKLEMELENQLREEEWKRAITGGTSLPGVSKQLSREERARLREQRIEQYSLARRLKMEGKDKASEKKDAASESSHNDELSGIRLPAQKLAVGEYGEASSSNTVLLESVEGSGPPKGKFCGNLPGRGTSCGVPEAQTTVMACSAASRRPNGQSFVTANWPVAETSSENVNSVAGSWQQFSCFSGQYQNVDWNKRQYRSTGEGASSTCSNRSGILSRKGVSAPRVVHNEFLVRKSFQNVYDSCTGSLARGERINLQGYSEYGVSRSAKNSTGPCCSGETVGLSSARTRPVNWMCHGMRRAGQSRPEACNTASMSLPWRSTVSVPSKQTEAANETAVLQETRPASADFYRTARAPSYVNESASSSTDSALWSVDNDGEASQEESAAAAKGFVDYPAFKDGQLRWFRIVEPVGTRIILQRDEPLKEHDYFLPTVEQIVANEWKFLVEPIDETSPIEKTEFLLQFGQQFEDPQQTANIDDTNCAEK
ncbi:hypothetical protein Tcan_08692 [Toxocara canis]|uniref:Uncharacterized protein n=1 Tax=Toxocara canis TaxID=6265 RepID=A0A0B2VKM4_TOXCA|nr:hypothetical protein Tcan_08692 [Toxocara canis]